jgi:hypothetical protein
MSCSFVSHKIRDPRRPDFGRTVLTLTAVFHVLPRDMAVHTSALLCKTFWIALTEASFFPALVSLSFVLIT